MSGAAARSVCYNLQRQKSSGMKAPMATKTGSIMEPVSSAAYGSGACNKHRSRRW